MFHGLELSISHRDPLRTQATVRPEGGAPYVAYGVHSVQTPYDARTDTRTKHRTTHGPTHGPTPYDTVRHRTTPYDTVRRPYDTVRHRTKTVRHTDRKPTGVNTRGSTSRGKGPPPISPFGFPGWVGHSFRVFVFSQLNININQTRPECTTWPY